MSEPSSGIQTTEFWKGLLLAMLNVAVTAGVVSQQDQTQLSGAVTSGVAGVAVVIANAWIVVNYVKQRSQLKSDHLTAQK